MHFIPTYCAASKYTLSEKNDSFPFVCISVALFILLHRVQWDGRRCGLWRLQALFYERHDRGWRRREYFCWGALRNLWGANRDLDIMASLLEMIYRKREARSRVPHDEHLKYSEMMRCVLTVAHSWSLIYCFMFNHSLEKVIASFQIEVGERCISSAFRPFR